MSTSQPLPATTALWRIVKLSVAEIRDRLRAAGLSPTGTKRTLAKRLHESLTREVPPSPSAGDWTDRSGSDSHPSAQDTEGAHHAAKEEVSSPARPRHHRHRRPRQRQNRHSRRRASTNSGSTISSTSSDTSSSASSSRSSTSSRSSVSRSQSSSSPRSRGDRRRSPHRSARARRHSSSPALRSAKRIHSRRRHHRDRQHHESGRHSHRSRSRRSRPPRDSSPPARSLGALSQISRRLQGRIRRSEFVNLTQLLHANLTKASIAKADRHKRDTSSAASPTRRGNASITDFASWSEA